MLFSALETRTFNGAEFLINNNYLGKGYGVISDLEREAIQLCAKLGGILLNPVELQSYSMMEKSYNLAAVSCPFINK